MQSTAAKYSFRNAALQSSTTGGEGLLLISSLFGGFVGLALRGSFKPSRIAVELAQSLKRDFRPQTGHRLAESLFRLFDTCGAKR